MPVVRGANAHQVTQTRAGSTLPKWGTQDFNLALLAAQQEGPRERIPYPRPIENDARGALRPKVLGTQGRPGGHDDASGCVRWRLRAMCGHPVAPVVVKVAWWLDLVVSLRIEAQPAELN